ncbi:hypothetical protein D9M71_839170 [compost metagenome]
MLDTIDSSFITGWLLILGWLGASSAIGATAESGKHNTPNPVIAPGFFVLGVMH